jgi:uncharacterized protein
MMGKKRGLAVLDDATKKRIAALGGKAAHRLGRAHEFTPEEAKAAGRKGGKAQAKNRTSR